VFAPKDAKADTAPTIAMSHGWGGTAESMRPNAVRFAQAGFPGKLVTIGGVRHFGNYNEARDRAQAEAVAWFDAHLQPAGTKGSK
jgi:dienelactone hydrolase